MKRIYSEATLNARENMIRFAVKEAGISAVHPNPDPHQWPAPHGQNVSKPKENIMRDQFNYPKKEKDRKEKHEKIVNRTMLHNCKKGYCSTEDSRPKKKGKKKDSSKPDTASKENSDEVTCKAGYPMKFLDTNPLTKTPMTIKSLMKL